MITGYLEKHEYAKSCNIRLFMGLRPQTTLRFVRVDLRSYKGLNI